MASLGVEFEILERNITFVGNESTEIQYVILEINKFNSSTLHSVLVSLVLSLTDQTSSAVLAQTSLQIYVMAEPSCKFCTCGSSSDPLHPSKISMQR